MLRTRVGSVVPPTTPSPTVGERILSNWSNARRQEFELAMRQAMMEYQEGKLTQSQMVAERQRAIELLAKDLQNIRNTREKLLSGELDRSAALQRFNAGQENAARRTYSSQAFAAQRDATREAATTAKEATKQEKINLNARQTQIASSVIVKAINDWMDMDEEDREEDVDQYIDKKLIEQIQKPRDVEGKPNPLAGVDLDELRKQRDVITENIRQAKEPPSETVGEPAAATTAAGAMATGIRTPDQQRVLADLEMIKRGLSEDEDEEMVSDARRSTDGAVGYRPAFAGKGRISEDVRKELDALAAQKAGILETLREIYDRPLPEVDEFDLIDQTRRIWREKFGRNPSAEETRSIFRKAKSPEPVEPVEDVMGVAGSREELKERVAELQGTTTPTPSPSVESEVLDLDQEMGETPIFPAPLTTEEEREQFIQSLTPRERASYDAALRETLSQRQPAKPSPILDMDTILGMEPITPAPLATRELVQTLTPRERASYDAALKASLSPIQPAKLSPVLDLDKTMEMEPIRPLPVSFEDVDDIYSRAVQRARSGSITIGPKDRETVDRTIQIWKNSGKKQSIEQLIETIEKGFEDMPEERVEQILAYMIQKMNAEMNK